MVDSNLLSEVEKREIKHVWHFTRLSNAESILKHGLLSRQELKKLGMQSDFNDDYRLDDQEDAICCSLGHPNYKMFYSLRQNNPNIKWVVFGMKSNILLKKDCAFCVSNAASNEVTCLPIACRKGTGAFNKLFDEIDGKPSRTELGIPDDCPTNPQAEILVFDRIEPEYIIGAITQNKATESELKTKYPNFQFQYHRALFSARKDYKHW